MKAGVIFEQFSRKCVVIKLLLFSVQSFLVSNFVLLTPDIQNTAMFVHLTPGGRPGMSDVTLMSGISGLSFDSLLFFLPSPLALLVVLSFFC